MALCAGGGGLELGLHLAIPDYRTILWCEYDQRAAATLVSNFGHGLDEAPIWDDVRTLDGTAWRGLVDIVTAGFPCQPFSDAGRKGGEGDDRHLWPDVLRVVRECQPRYVFLENVPGILTTYAADGRPAAIVVRHDLEALGFRVEEGLFSAAEVGLPHKRIRWFLLGHSNKARLQGRQQPVRSGPYQRPPWPPGPESDEWADWPEWAYPATESSFRGAADGLAGGMDLCLCSRRERLQRCGNGVVPMTAALAWRTLTECRNER